MYRFSPGVYNIERPLVTETLANVTVTAQGPLAESERLRIEIEAEGVSKVTLIDLSAGDSWDSVTPLLRSGPGALAQTSLAATRARFVIDAVSTSGSTNIEISGIRFEETGRMPDQTLRETSLVSFEFFASMIDTFSDQSLYTREFGDLGSLRSVSLNVRYHGVVNPVDPTTLGDDDLCIEGAELLGLEPKITFVSAHQGEGLHTNATYRLHRPSGGWEVFERQGKLKLAVCLGGVLST